MNTKPMPGVMLYFDRLSFLDRLDDAQTGRLFRALIRYARDGEAPIIEDVMFGVVWDVLRPMVDYDAQKYAEVCEKRRRGIQQRWEKVHKNTYEYTSIPNTNTAPDSDQTETSTSPNTDPDSEPSSNPHTNPSSQPERKRHGVVENFGGC